ncbi:hypothetical protein [Xanthobacter versatilis]|uniref:hypothetical protein n=1 Tax=Xanthobacter autotrophicus (strain ATCC BAA-1158 / Py2) TaxID=78245 RepID=UPI0037278A85
MAIGDIISLTQPGASGNAPVTGSFTSATNSAAFIPLAGRPFNVSVYGTFVGTVQLKRSFDGSTWLPLTAAGVTLYSWSAPASEPAEEAEFGVSYRLECTAYSSGTINYRISQ